MEQARKGSFMIIAILIVGNFLALINETVMNVALPKIIDDFGISANTAQWLSTGYMLMIGIAVPDYRVFNAALYDKAAVSVCDDAFYSGNLAGRNCSGLPARSRRTDHPGFRYRPDIAACDECDTDFDSAAKTRNDDRDPYARYLICPGDRSGHLRLYCRTLFMARCFLHDAASIGLHDFLCGVPLEKCNRTDVSEN